MPEIQRILCPVDYSDASRHAIEQAAMIAGWFGARVTVLHVLAPVAVVEGPLLFAALPAGTERPRVTLADYVQPLRAAGLTVDDMVREDHDVAGCILDCAASLPADLLVMGTHGRSGIGWLMLGSVTDDVLRKAACPVLTVPPTALHAAKPPFKRVLCPVDFSDASLEAVRVALALAQEADARLTLLHVLPLPRADDSFAAIEPPATRIECEQTARRRLDALVPDESRTYCDPVPRVVWGKPYRSIVDIAHAEAADLIVMGIRGRGILDRMFLGSNTSQVVRHATCPVLTVRT